MQPPVTPLYYYFITVGPLRLPFQRDGGTMVHARDMHAAFLH